MMDVIIRIVHWDDGSQPHKELRIYDGKGNTIGFGKMKVADTKVMRPITDQQELFNEDEEHSREITYIATLDLRKLAESVDGEK